eukprot:scaffold3956_cov169-Chaetoceros_neogracile.AAC.2
MAEKINLTAPQSPAVPDSIVGGTIVSVVPKVVRKKKKKKQEKKQRKKRTCKFQLPNGRTCPIPETCSGRGNQLSCVLIKVHREKERVVPKDAGQRVRTCQVHRCPNPETCRGRGARASCVLNVKDREKGKYPKNRKSALCSVCNKDECKLGNRKRENCLEWGKVPP